jgi:hypothetical protein
VINATLLHKLPKPDPSYLSRSSVNCVNLLLAITRTLPDSQRVQSIFSSPMYFLQDLKILSNFCLLLF